MLLGKLDVRWSQILVLTSLLVGGSLAFDLSIDWRTPLVVLPVCLLVQAVGQYFLSPTLPFNWPSPMITGLSLTLLLRTNALGWVVLAAVLAIGSKFLFRWGGRHFFNPANFAIVVLLVVLPDSVWVSPGQWGTSAWYLGLALCCGGMVLHVAARQDVTWVFLLTFSVLVFGRGYWLGDPLAIALRQLQSGNLLVFAFFMISDPKTVPQRAWMRSLFAVGVAFLAYFGTFFLYSRTAMFYSLWIACCAVPLLNHWRPGPSWQWQRIGPKELV